MGDEQQGQDDFKVAMGGSICRVAGGALVLTGVLAAFCRAQLIGVVAGTDLLKALMMGMYVIPVLLIIAGLMLLKARTFAAFLGGVGGLGGGLWLVGFFFAALQGNAFILLPAVAGCVSLIAGAFSLAAIPATRRAAKARLRLRDEGLDMSF